MSAYSEGTEEVEHYNSCGVCTDTKIQVDCSRCIKLLEKFGEVSECCNQRCLMKTNREGNQFACMNYVRRIRKDMQLNFDDSDKRIAQLTKILKRKCSDFIYHVGPNLHFIMRTRM